MFCFEKVKRFVVICAYCGKETKGTKEHIISNAILKLFPDCSFTYDEERAKVHHGDPMVKDVCAECNNIRLSYIDSYAKSIIESYFVRDYESNEVLDFEYELALIQKLCLKYAFNDLRSRKKDITFFDDSIKCFLLDNTHKESLRNVTILAGLAVNMFPDSEIVSMFGDKKLRWGASPLMLSHSLIPNINFLTGQESYRSSIEEAEFEGCALSYVFRFNSLQILLFCWDKKISDELLTQNKNRLVAEYPYQLLNSSGKSMLSRCTGRISFIFENIIDTRGGQCLADEARITRHNRKCLEVERATNMSDLAIMNGNTMSATQEIEQRDR